MVKIEAETANFVSLPLPVALYLTDLTSASASTTASQVVVVVVGVNFGKACFCVLKFSLLIVAATLF